MENYLRVNLMGPGRRLIKKEFTGPRSHKGWETLAYYVKSIMVCMLCALQKETVVSFCSAHNIHTTMDLTQYAATPLHST